MSRTGCAAATDAALTTKDAQGDIAAGARALGDLGRSELAGMQSQAGECVLQQGSTVGFVPTCDRPP